MTVRSRDRFPSFLPSPIRASLLSIPGGCSWKQLDGWQRRLAVEQLDLLLKNPKLTAGPHQAMPCHPSVNLLSIPLTLDIQERRAGDGDARRVAALLDLRSLQHMLAVAGFSLRVGVRVPQPLNPQLQQQL